MKAHSQFYMDCHLAGRKFHDADLVWRQLHVGDKLRLEREADNHYDPKAVQVIFRDDGEDYLLGYIPRDCNTDLAAFFDAGWGDLFECRISALSPDLHPEEQIHLTLRIQRRTATKKKEPKL